MVSDSIGYIRLGGFTESASAEVKAAFNELKEKAPKVMAMGSIRPKTASDNSELIDNSDKYSSNIGMSESEIFENESLREVQADALSALINLGYSQGDAASAISRIEIDSEGLDVQLLIRSALRLLAPKG